MGFDFKSLTGNKIRRLTTFLAVLFFVGIILITLSKNTKDQQSSIVSDTKSEQEKTDSISSDDYCSSIEKKLEGEFGRIEGVGKVEVTIILKSKGEVILNKDTPTQISSTVENDGQTVARETNETDQGESTVILNDNDGNEKPIIIKELLPEVNGILIIAEGGENPTVKNNLIQAAKVLLNLPANKIEVLKMGT